MAIHKSSSHIYLSTNEDPFLNWTPSPNILGLSAIGLKSMGRKVWQNGTRFFQIGWENNGVNFLSCFSWWKIMTSSFPCCAVGDHVSLQAWRIFLKKLLNRCGNILCSLWKMIRQKLIILPPSFLAQFQSLYCNLHVDGLSIDLLHEKYYLGVSLDSTGKMLTHLSDLYR